MASRSNMLIPRPTIAILVALLIAGLGLAPVDAFAQNPPDSVCAPGTEIRVGELCEYPGNSLVEFSVDDSGRGNFLHLTDDLAINARNVSIDGVFYNFAATKIDDLTRVVEAVGDSSVELTSRQTISSDFGYTCALRPDGSPVCWGLNNHGQALPPGDEKFVFIDAGDNDACGLREDGSPVCWGWDIDGLETPPPDQRLVSISIGHIHSCGLRLDRSAVCWVNPSYDYGQASPPAGERFTYIISGDEYTCGLRPDGSPVCWGLDNEGQASPPSGERFTTISAGSNHTCGLTGNGSAVCWGRDEFGQSSPPIGERFTSVISGDEHTCGLRPDGSPVCWGLDNEGQASPPSGERFTSISAGDDFTCGIRQDGSATCWGWDSYGQLSPPVGLRVMASSDQPAPAPIPEPRSDADLEALYGLYNATDGPNWSNNGNWLSDRPLAAWYGVTTDPTGRVVGLSLAANDLRGKLPDDMFTLLTRLRTLRMGQNQLSGEIPPGLDNLNELQLLDFEYNQLEGPIPPGLGDLTDLTYLNLSVNRLSGEIPTELGNLRELETLALDFNQLSGAMPPELGNLTYVQILALHNNQLTGEIPRELENLANLRELKLEANRLSGCIPAALGAVEHNDLSRLGLPFCTDRPTPAPAAAPKSAPAPNHAPEAIGAISDRTLRVGESVTLNASSVFIDLDDDLVTEYRWTFSDPDVTGWTENAPGELTLDGKQVGTTQVSVRAYDGHSWSDDLSFEVRVEERRGFFVNSVSVEQGLGEDWNIFDPVTLSVLGILLTLVATGIQLFKGR